MTRFESIFVSLLICVLSNGALAYFNLFISPKEVKKLMGLDMELYYVKEGIVNNYAVGYILTVNSSIEELEFTWQSLRRQPVSNSSTSFFSNFFLLLSPSTATSSWTFLGYLAHKNFLENFTVTKASKDPRSFE